MRWVAAICVLCATLSAQAVMFQRDILTIAPKPLPILLDENGKPAQKQPEPRETIRFYTELRDEQALKLDWVHSLNRISAQRTMTILFDPPRYDHIQRQNVYQPIDILSISPQGRIVQIASEIVLADLNAPIETSSRVKARLVLQGGAAKQLEIQPGDRVEHPAFVPEPKIETE